MYVTSNTPPPRQLRVGPPSWKMPLSVSILFFPVTKLKTVHSSSFPTTCLSKPNSQKMPLLFKSIHKEGRLRILSPTKNPSTMSSPKHLRLRPFSILILTVLLVFSALPSHSSSAAADNSLTAYEVLEEYDFPVGLLPNGVLGYELDNSTGEFTVSLNGTCTYSVDSYELKYSSAITGVISTDELSSLSGIKVKVWFFWLSIVKVVRDGDELEFSVGIASADFAVSNFGECPTCGCGFDCDGVEKERKFRVKQPSWASA